MAHFVLINKLMVIKFIIYSNNSIYWKSLLKFRKYLVFLHGLYYNA